nr:MAG TPA: hypothetical protein [Crassvirales sp.]
MVIFDQLRISDDGRRMYINVHVNKADYFNNAYIDSITIMTSDKVLETAPETPTSEYIYTKKIDGNEKEVNLVLTANDFTKTWEKDPKAMPFKQGDMSRTLFFVYVKCKWEGAPGECIPCTLDEETTLGVTFDENILYQRVMNYTKDLLDECKVPVGFMDFILLWNAFKASIETEHYIPAIKFFNMLFGIVDALGHKGIIKGCGCNG